MLFSLLTVRKKQTAPTKSLSFEGSCPPPGRCCEFALPLEGAVLSSLGLCWDVVAAFYLFSFLEILPLLGQAL